MTATPTPATRSLRTIRTPIVYVGEPWDIQPNRPDEPSNDWTVLSLTQSAGPVPDTLVLRPRKPFSESRVGSSTSQLRSVNGRLGEELDGRIVEVWTRDPEKPAEPLDPLFVGRIINVQLDVSESAETETVVALLDAACFGRPVRSQQHRTRQFSDPETWTAVERRASWLSNTDLVFNPIDEFGQVRPNRTNKRCEFDFGRDVTEPIPDTEDGVGIRVSTDQFEQYLFVADGERDLTITDEETEWRRSDDPRVEDAYVFPAREWTITEALATLQALTNPFQGLVKNATEGELNDVLTVETRGVEGIALLRGDRVPRGTTLPDALQLLLEPRGYSFWTPVTSIPRNELPHNPTNPEVLLRDPTRARITVFPFGRGPIKQVYLDKIDKPRTAKTNVLQAVLNYSVAAAVQTTRVVGDYLVREASIPLQRAWPKESIPVNGEDPTNYDEPDLRDLERVDGELDPEYLNVWRLFVANESGDVTGLRDDNFDANELDGWTGDDGVEFGETIPDGNRIPEQADGESLEAGPPFDDPRMRRLLQNPVSFRSDVDRTESVVTAMWRQDPDRDWQLVPRAWGMNLLEDQIGIYFSGSEGLDELIAADDPQIKLCCSFRTPRYLRATETATSEFAGAEGDELTTRRADGAELFIDVADRYARRSRNDTPTDDEATAENSYKPHDYRSVYETAFSPLDRRKDWDAIEKFAKDVQARAGLADVQGSITLRGITLAYSIGDLIDVIQGRSIFLDRGVFDEGLAYPQVLRRVFDFVNETTTLVLESRTDSSSSGNLIAEDGL